MRLPRSVSLSIDKVARQALGSQWNLYATLIERWSEIVGPDYASQTAPVKIVFPHGKKAGDKWAQGRQGGGTLTISLPHGLSFAFSHQSETVKNRINAFFGYEAIDKIALKTSYTSDDKPLSLPPAPLSKDQKASIENAVDDIENNELRDALLQLGSSVLANRKKI